MKIYNYSDLPLIIDGSTVTHHEVNLPTNYDRNLVTHNDVQFLNNANSKNNNVVYMITQHRSGNEGHYRIKLETYEVPNIWLWAGIFLSFFSFFFLVRIMQKLKLR